MRRPKTGLERDVARWLQIAGEGYDDKEQGAYDDLMKGGCRSGMVGHLIGYADSCRFYRKHRDEINALLANLLDETGDTIRDLFRQWDKSDPLALEERNRQLLAWFGFEETAHRLMD